MRLTRSEKSALTSERKKEEKKNEEEDDKKKNVCYKSLFFIGGKRIEKVSALPPFWAFSCI